MRPEKKDQTTGDVERRSAMPCSVATDADFVKCHAGVSHNWGKWKVTDKLVCTNWGTVTLIQSRQCSICGITQAKKQNV